MTSWWLKATIQGIISLFPQHTQINYLLQRKLSKRLILSPSRLHTKLKQANNLLTAYQEHKGKLPRTALELGTGWQPIIPIALSLMGVQEVFTVDKQSLMKHELIVELLEALIGFCQTREIEKSLAQIQTTAQERLENALSILKSTHNIHASLESLGIYSKVMDAQELQTQEVGHPELIFSVSTYEHIPSDVLLGIMNAFRRVIAEDGLMLHLIDLSDHYAHADSSITRYHFLRHPQWLWNLVNNTLQYQNRLRISDYREIHHATGFEILSEENETSSEEAIKNIKVAKEFKDYLHSDLIVIVSLICSEPIRKT